MNALSLGKMRQFSHHKTKILGVRLEALNFAWPRYVVMIACTNI